jgi:cobalt transporter subunit CbtB
MSESKTLAIHTGAVVQAVAFPRIPVPAASLRATPAHTAALHAAVAGALGLLMLWGVGFAGNGVWHETAHDTRHALGFPCH